MTIGNRIKKIRKELDMTQAEFATRIGSVQNSVTRYENNQRNPSSTVIALICREFDVREEWLRTGEGEMFKLKPSDVLDQLAYKYKISNADYVIIEKYLSLRPEIRKGMFEYFREVTAALEKIDPNVPVYNSEEKSCTIDDFIEDSPAKIQDHEPTTEELEAEYKKNISVFARDKGFTALNIIDDIEKTKEA